MPPHSNPGAASLVLVTEEIDAECRRWLTERCEVVDCSASDARFAELLPKADALVIRTYTTVDPALLARAPKLRVVGRAGVGIDNIDLPACKSRDVRVVHTPDANTIAVVELMTAFVFDAIRPRLFLDRAAGLKEWKSLRAELVGDRQLADLTVGILGFGRVGSRVARVMAPLAGRVIYNDLLDIPADRRAGASPVSVEELFRAADIVTIHVDGRPENRDFVNARLLALCKKGVLFLNTSRGFVVDVHAVADLLKRDPDAKAILDVHEPEPFGADYPLLGLDNAFLSPHIGAATVGAHRNMSWVVRDVWRVLSGETPQYA
ncbi:MAG TPA: NAD(P)-dependent oxidoreductase, partial [Phycisphaerales bacterium]|nr:NAD(P)-dependent oxidoreductase [Phycisphaerales bacterium]